MIASPFLMKALTSHLCVHLIKFYSRLPVCQAQGIYLKSGPQMPLALVEHIGPRGKQTKNHLGKASNCHERCEEKAGKIMNEYSREFCLCVREAERRA